MTEESCIFYFNSAEEDSLYAMCYLRREKGMGKLSEIESRQLAFMEKREKEGRIYLTPAVIYAAANQQSCKRWFQSVETAQQKKWYDQGVEWMRCHPAFLEKFGWKERKSALIAAGIMAGAEAGPSANTVDQIRRMMKNGWKFLWERMKKIPALDARTWEEMRAPWKDSAYMGCAMAGVILLMAALHGKSVRERDRMWRDMQRLQAFTKTCLRPPASKDLPGACYCEEDERMTWLMAHFKNPQRPAYIREKGRISSDWLDQLYQVMAVAGLPASACETMTLSSQEVEVLLEIMEDKMTERQYMTFLMLYAVARELAQAGRAAAATDMP